MRNKSEVIKSFSQLPKVFGYISKNAWIWAYLIVPWILNLLLLFIFWFIVFNSLQTSILGLGFIAGAAGIWTGIINFVLFMVTGFLGVLVFYLFATIIASPFNGLMVESMLKRAGYSKNTDEGLMRSILYEILRSLKFEAIKLTLIILFILGSILLGFLPIIGVFVASVITYFGNTYLAVVEYYDPVLSSTGINVKDRFRYVRTNIRSNFGLFMLSGLMIYIPIINILYIPFAVITATLTYINSHSKR